VPAMAMAVVTQSMDMVVVATDTVAVAQVHHAVVMGLPMVVIMAHGAMVQQVEQIQP